MDTVKRSAVLGIALGALLLGSPSVTREQKAQIVAEITQTLVRVLGKKPEQTHIVIDEVELDNWGFSGMLTSDYRKREK